MTVPNIVMNSLVSPTKVVTNDAIPNPIVATHNTISLPTIPVPVTSICIPIVNMKSESEVKSAERGFSDAETVDAEDDKLCDSKKIDEPMPVEDDPILEIAAKIEDETDIEVTDVAETPSENVKVDEDLVVEPALNKSDDLHTTNDQLSATEPMECASVISMASPKHTMANDVIMTESVSVCNSLLFSKSVRLHAFRFIVCNRPRPQEVCRWKAQIHR